MNMETTELEIIPAPPPAPAPPLQIGQLGLTKIVDLRALWDVFVSMKGQLMPRTLDDYRYYGNRFCNFIGERKITPQILKEWMAHVLAIKCRRNGVDVAVGAAKLNGMNVRVRGFIRWLNIYEYLEQDHSRCIPMLPMPAPKTAETFTEKEYQQVKDYCHGRLWCQPHLWLIILAYRTGMSLVDCCHLRWRDVHLSLDGPSFIDIYRIKTQRMGQKAMCQIPIVPFTDVHDWLVMLKKAEPSNYKRHDGITDFVHQDCPGLHWCTFQRIQNDFRNILSRSGVVPNPPGRTFRHFRNTFISNLVNSGVQMNLIMKMTGHNNAMMLMRYLRADRTALQEGAQKSFEYAQAQAKTI